MLPLEVVPVLAVWRQPVEHTLKVRDGVFDLSFRQGDSAPNLASLWRGTRPRSLSAAQATALPSVLGHACEGPRPALLRLLLHLLLVLLSLR